MARAARDFFKDFDFLAAEILQFRSPAGAVCEAEGVLAALRERALSEGIVRRNDQTPRSRRRRPRRSILILPSHRIHGRRRMHWRWHRHWRRHMHSLAHFSQKHSLTTAVAAAELSQLLTTAVAAVANAELLERSTSMGVSSLVIGRWQNAIPGSGTAEEKQKRKSVMNAICKKRKAAAALVD